MKKIKYLGVALIAQLTPLAVFAAAPTSGIPQVGLDKQKIADLISGFATYFSGIIGVLGILVLLYAAFLYMTAGGNDEKVSKAKSTFIYGLVGVGVAILAFGVFNLVSSFLTA
ncbi:MAG: hypothetical protein V1845_03915 [bacterium]